tara:strand:- start:215 stop:643 length:429 start_codon:yes stop_codon:yes gene_type:complete
MDNIYETIALHILQFIDVPEQQNMELAVQNTYNKVEHVLVKAFGACRLISKEWYRYEHMSRCKYCSGRYIFNKKLECFRCKHVKRPVVIPNNIIWINRKLTIHKLLTHVIYFSGKKNQEYIWGNTKSIMGWISRGQLETARS